jgi:hypothetical protein
MVAPDLSGVTVRTVGTSCAIAVGWCLRERRVGVTLGQNVSLTRLVSDRTSTRSSTFMIAIEKG